MIILPINSCVHPASLLCLIVILTDSFWDLDEDQIINLSSVQLTIFSSPLLVRLAKPANFSSQHLSSSSSWSW